MERHRPLKPWALVTSCLAAAIVLALPSCTSRGAAGVGDGGDGTGNPAPSVIAPGRPGQEAATLSPEEAARARGTSRPNQADFAYVRKMIPHHRQALDMARLAARYAKSRGVRGIADRIEAAQRPEIAAMRAWLEQSGPGGSSGGDGHEHSGMPGMATKAQLARLRQARGADFDELFVKLMTAHHQGAVEMATDVLSQGNDVRVEEMATEVIAQQSSEIDRMRDL